MRSKVDPTPDCAEQHEGRDDELGLKQDLVGRAPERSHRCHLQIVSQGIPGPKVAHTGKVSTIQEYSNNSNHYYHYYHDNDKNDTTNDNDSK